MSKIKSYFENHAHHHPYHNHHAYNKDPSFYDSIISHMQKIESGGRIKVLDVGCGDGSFIKSTIMTGIDALFVGTDLSHTLINSAKNNLDYKRVELFVADGFKLPIKSETKFDLIHIDSVLHHLIGNTKYQSMSLVKLLLKVLSDRLSENGVLVIGEMHYVSHIKPTITSSIIFYGLKLLNFLHLDISRILNEFQPGLEVNFLYDKEIEKLLEQYGAVRLIKKELWTKIPKLYQFFLLKEAGQVYYMVTALSMHKQNKLPS
jgi:SAM-dependent methyltransferase